MGERTVENPIKVSVVIPVYNGGLAFAKCLDDLIHQTLQEIEIICVNDGSTDKETLEILERYERWDKRVKVFHQENQGAGAARNHGLSKAVGKYLSFLDADDFFEPDMLEKAYLAAEAQQADISIFRGDRYDDDKREFLPMAYSIKKEMLPASNPFNYKDVKEHVFTFIVGWAWDKLYLREFVIRENLQFQNTRTSNDLLFVFSSMVKAKSIYTMDDLLIHHRINLKDSLSVTREKSWNCFFVAGRALYEELVRMGIYEEVKRAYLSWMLHFSFWNLDSIVGPSFEKVYQLLKDEVFPFMELTSYERTYFQHPKLYDRAMEILETNAHEYLLAEIVPKRAAEQQLKEANAEIKKLKVELAKQKEKYAEIKKSRCYRIGKIVLYLPWKFKQIFKKA